LDRKDELVSRMLSLTRFGGFFHGWPMQAIIVDVIVGF
jgi:hypothetical protein